MKTKYCSPLLYTFLLSCCFCCTALLPIVASKVDEQRATKNIVIVGAGMAGLSGAASLLGVLPSPSSSAAAESKSQQVFFNITLIEASHRVGGRMRTARFEESSDTNTRSTHLYQAELGATFIHGGRSHNDDLLDFVKRNIIWKRGEAKMRKRRFNNETEVLDKFPLRLVAFDYSRGAYFDFDGSLFDRDEWHAVREVFGRVIFKELAEFKKEQISKRAFCMGGGGGKSSSSSAAAPHRQKEHLCQASSEETDFDADQPMSVSLDELGVFAKEKLLSLPPLKQEQHQQPSDTIYENNISTIESNRRLFDLFCFQFIVQEWQAPLQDLSTAHFDGERSLSIDQEDDLAIVGEGGAGGIAQAMLDLLLAVGRGEGSAFHFIRNRPIDLSSGGVASALRELKQEFGNDVVVVFAVPLGVLKDSQQQQQHQQQQKKEKEEKKKKEKEIEPEQDDMSFAMKNAIADSGVSSVVRVAVCWNVSSSSSPRNRIFWGSSFFGGGPVDETEVDDIKSLLEFALDRLPSADPSAGENAIGEMLDDSVLEEEVERRYWGESSPLAWYQEQQPKFVEQQQHQMQFVKPDYTADFFFHKWSSLCRGRVPYADSDEERADWEDFELTADDLAAAVSEEAPVTQRGDDGKANKNHHCARYGRGPHVEFVNMWRLSNGTQPCLQVEMEDARPMVDEGMMMAGAGQGAKKSDSASMLRHIRFELGLMFGPRRCRERNRARFELFRKLLRETVAAFFPSSADRSPLMYFRGLEPLLLARMESFFEKRVCPNVTLPTWHRVADWKAEPHARGGYFFPRVDGNGCELQCALNGVGCERCSDSDAAKSRLKKGKQQQQQQQQRFVFAGEHVYPEIYGNMEGAMLSGIIAADLVRKVSNV